MGDSGDIKRRYYDTNEKMSKSSFLLYGGVYMAPLLLCKFSPHEVNGKKILPHTHRGYEHASTRDLTAAEKAMVANVKRIWNNYLSRTLV